MPARGIFVTGTDTGVGKTVASVALLRVLASAGLRAVGMKPIAAGIDAGTDINADVAALAAASNIDAPLPDRSPFAFTLASAPHVAAREQGVAIDVDRIARAYRRLARAADAVVVEGAGGALVPVDGRHDMLDLAALLEIPVLLVVGVRLGCLNHAQLSALAIRARGLALVGWIATRIDPDMPFADDNVAWLRESLGAPLIADIREPSVASIAPTMLAILGFRPRHDAIDSRDR